MFNFFRKNKSTIKSISIPSFGWLKNTDNEALIGWTNEENTMGLSINFFNIAPNIPTITNIEGLRDFYRNSITQAQGGLIEVNIIDLKGVQAIKTIFKIPQEPTGMVYLAALTIPFEKCSYVIKIQAPEFGITGMRDTVIMQKLLKESKVSIGENGLENWFQDPYNPLFKNKCLMNKSEDSAYDAIFPHHPLAQARKLMATIEAEIAFNSEINTNRKFNK